MKYMRRLVEAMLEPISPTPAQVDWIMKFLDTNNVSVSQVCSRVIENYKLNQINLEAKESTVDTSIPLINVSVYDALNALRISNSGNSYNWYYTDKDMTINELRDRLGSRLYRIPIKKALVDELIEFFESEPLNVDVVCTHILKAYFCSQVDINYPKTTVTRDKPLTRDLINLALSRYNRGYL